MSHSLTLLAWTALLGLVHLGAAALAKRFQEPPGWGAGSRDEQLPPYTGVAARLSRAQSNFMETMPFFAVGVLICAVAQRGGGLLDWGASLYFWARLVYLPLYASGLPYIRTAAWLVATAGLAMVLVACLTSR
jgi:uncharacterized MAPEG superfamily protein